MLGTSTKGVTSKWFYSAGSFCIFCVSYSVWLNKSCKMVSFVADDSDWFPFVGWVWMPHLCECFVSSFTWRNCWPWLNPHNALTLYIFTCLFCSCLKFYCYQQGTESCYTTHKGCRWHCTGLRFYHISKLVKPLAPVGAPMVLKVKAECTVFFGL